MTNGAVICGVDGSRTAAKAAVAARRLADRHGLPLVYVHVVDGAGSEQRAVEGLRATGATETLMVEIGHPADRLVSLAGEHDAAFLVVGNHGPRSSLLGSVSADVARRAPCPVLVVPPTAANVAPEAAELEADGGLARFSLSGNGR